MPSRFRFLSGERIAIYGNAEPYEGDYDEPDRSVPNPRLFNYTHYIGKP